MHGSHILSDYLEVKDGATVAFKRSSSRKAMSLGHEELTFDWAWNTATSDANRLYKPVSQAKSSLLAHSSKKRFLRLDPKPEQSQCEHVSIAMDSVSLSDVLSLRNGYVHSTRISKNQQIWKRAKRLGLSDDWNNRNFFSTPICYSTMNHSGHHNLIGPMREGENTKKQTWKQNCESQQFIAPINLKKLTLPQHPIIRNASLNIPTPLLSLQRSWGNLCTCPSPQWPQNQCFEDAFLPTIFIHFHLIPSMTITIT